MRIAVKYIVGQYPQLPNISSVHNRFLHNLRLRLVPNGLLLGLNKITSFLEYLVISSFALKQRESCFRSFLSVLLIYFMENYIFNKQVFQQNILVMMLS